MRQAGPPREAPEDPAFDRLVRDLAAAQGMPSDDPEFGEVVAAFRGLWAAVDAIGRIPIDPAREPAPRYGPRS
jgi:hypothetical protein